MTTAPADRKQAPTEAELGLPAKPPEVSSSADAAAHARARVDRQLRALLAHHDGTREGSDPEELHQFRVAIRRLRSLLKSQPHATTIADDLKWLGSVTSPVRDADVLLLRLGDHIADLDDEDAATAGELTAAVRTERGRHRRRLGQALSSDRYRNLLTSLASLATNDSTESADADPLPPPGVVLVGSLRKPYRKLSAAVRALSADSPDDDVHRLRIRVKRLRYAAETAKPSAGRRDRKQLKAVVKACKQLQNVLGEHQDAVIAAERIRSLGTAHDDPAVAFVAGRITERENARRTAAREEWPRVWRDVDGAAKPLVR